uniref:Uncharacterized protein n=1 Tax=Oryzias latipes TaxID=8090 RepID=A0A3P9IMG5_ORYLA
CAALCFCKVPPLQLSLPIILGPLIIRHQSDQSEVIKFSLPCSDSAHKVFQFQQKYQLKLVFSGVSFHRIWCQTVEQVNKTMKLRDASLSATSGHFRTASPMMH